MAEVGVALTAQDFGSARQETVVLLVLDIVFVYRAAHTSPEVICFQAVSRVCKNCTIQLSVDRRYKLLINNYVKPDYWVAVGFLPKNSVVPIRLGVAGDSLVNFGFVR